MCHIMSSDNKGFIVVTFTVLSCLVHQLYGIGGKNRTTPTLKWLLHTDDLEQIKHIMHFRAER